MIRILAATTLGIAACGGDAAPSPCPDRFATDEWKATDAGAQKQRLAREAVDCRFVKPGDTKRQVARVLGRAERDELQAPAEYRREWVYYVGETNGYMGPADAQFLSVRFGADHTVAAVSVEP